MTALDPEIWRAVSEVAVNVRVTPSTVLYHLWNMEKEGIVERNEGGSWKLRPSQQSTLTDFLVKRKKSAYRKRDLQRPKEL